MNQDIATALAQLNTCIPGEIVSYDGKWAKVKPSMPKQLTDGSVLKPPQIIHVPVCWPIADGGKAMITVPLKQGDPVLLYFSQRSIENWLSGADQAPDDPRQFDMSDCFCAPVMRPGPKADTDNVCVRYGEGTMKLNASGELTIEVKNMRVKTGQFTVDADQTTYNSPVKITDDLVITGSKVEHSGVKIGKNHKHTGVQSGSSVSGPVKP